MLTWCLAGLLLAGLPAAAAGPAGVAKAGSVVFPEPVTYWRGAPFRRLTRTEAERLEDVPVRFGADVPGVRYAKDGEPDRTVTTCRQYAAALRDGYAWTNNFENKMAGFLTRACGLLDAALRVRPARRSSIASPRAGVASLDAVSAEALPGFGEETNAEHARLRGVSLRRYVREHGCRIALAAASELQIACADATFQLVELLRGDVLGDGTEQIAVSAYVGADGGTFSSVLPAFLLTRRSDAELLAPVPLPR